MKIFALLILFSAATWLFMSSGKEQSNPEPSAIDDVSHAAAPSANASNSGRPKTSLSARKSLPTESNVKSAMSEADFISDLRSTDLGSVIALNDLVQKLRSQDPLRVSKFFTARLSALGSSNSEERGRLFQLGNALQSDALLPFWQDLAERKTPAYLNEAELINAAEPSFDSRVVLSEMSMAVRNLGLISYRDPAAGEILRNIAIHPQNEVHSTVIRQYAFEALKESDQVASMQIVRSLKKDDPLKKRLLSDAKPSK